MPVSFEILTTRSRLVSVAILKCYRRSIFAQVPFLKEISEFRLRRKGFRGDFAGGLEMSLRNFTQYLRSMGRDEVGGHLFHLGRGSAQERLAVTPPVFVH